MNELTQTKVGERKMEMKKSHISRFSVLLSIMFISAMIPVFAEEVPPEVEIQPITTNNMIHAYGRATIDGENIPVGAPVQAFDPDGTLCGQFKVTTQGYFGLMNIFADDPTTKDIDEGAVTEDTISFTIDGVPARVFNEEPVIFSEDGDTINVDLQVGAPDTTAPEILKVNVKSPIHLEITFSEAMDDITSNDPANYCIEDSEGKQLNINKATVQDDPKGILLNTEEIKEHTQYFITVKKDVTDLWRNKLGFDMALPFKQ